MATKSEIRRVTVRVTWPSEYNHSVESAFGEVDDLSLEKLRYASDALGDQFVKIIQVDGLTDRIDELMRESPVVTEYDVNSEGESVVVYMQCRLTKISEALKTADDEHAIVIDWPMHYLDAQEGLRAKLVGTDTAFREMMESLPSYISATLEQLGPYDREPHSFRDSLTGRQQEVFDLAVQEGYYQIPRGTSHKELAEILNLSPGTVSEHLQRIENKLVTIHANP